MPHVESDPTWGHVAMPFAALVPAAAVIAAATGQPLYAVVLVVGAAGAVVALEASRRVIET